MTSVPAADPKPRSFARQNPLLTAGALIIAVILFAVFFAEWLVPYPRHVGVFVNFAEANMPPSSKYLLGTDLVGRDILSRIVFGYRNSLLLGFTVLLLAVPVGSVIGLFAGYASDRVGQVIMRIADIFLSIPSLVLAMVVLGLFAPSQILAMVAISVVWWPWYARLVYGLARTLRGADFVRSAEVIGASHWRVMFIEILPNCVPIIITKVALDLGYVILLGASLSFIGLGAPPPIPDLGTMVADGAGLLPDLWWLCSASGAAIFLLVLGFNLLGDGLNTYLEAGS